MSYGLLAYACDIFALRRVIGVGIPLGDAVLARVRQGQSALIEAHDRWFAARIAEGSPTMDQALQRMILAPRLDGRHGYVFGYALRILAQQEGSLLEGDALRPATLSFLDEVDEGLARLAIPETFRLSRLAFSGPPAKLPAIDDFPAIGWIESSAVVAAREVFEQAKLEDPALSPRVRAALAEIQGWTVAAKGRGLVGFYF
jgi:hypothetical protein